MLILNLFLRPKLQLQVYASVCVSVCVCMHMCACMYQKPIINQFLPHMKNMSLYTD